MSYGAEVWQHEQIAAKNSEIKGDVMYSRIRYDLFFKKVFQQERILKAFLNTVLAEELSSPIQQLRYQNVEFLPQAERQYLNMIKHTIIDVFVTTEDGTRALIEIQKGSNKADLLRFIDYQCRNFSHQFKPGDDYTSTVPCYSICWLFDMTPPHKDFKEQITLGSNKKKSDWQANWEIIAIYPNCIRKEHLRQHRLESLEEWLLLDVVQDVKKAEQIKKLIHTPEIKEAFEQLDISGLTDEEIEELEFQQAITDRYQHSFQKHIKKRDIEIAQKLLSLGVASETIQQSTNLTENDVEHIRHMLGTDGNT
jgi:predicted transposase/invertase (TIGR01784 family)